MCGICGQINYKHKNIPTPPIQLIEHRGPDASGEWRNSSKTIYFGHTRLSILDLSPAGCQPMTDASGRYTLIFNGEIYNHLQLRTLLPQINWKGSSDTETLLELFALRGIDALSLLQGMFAFALCDTKDDSVWLVRDRLGIKPLYYRYENDVFDFASEVRVLLYEKTSSLNIESLSEYIAFGHMPAHGQVLKGIYSHSPGCYRLLRPDGSVEEKVWWPQNNSFSIRPQSQLNYTQQVKKIVTETIVKHLISDVPVGAFLSGGIDSSIITLVAGKVLGKQLNTFTVGFPHVDFDERRIAQQVAQKANSEHFEIEVNDEQCTEWVKQAVLCLDLPSVDAINTFIVSKAVNTTGIKVAISGLGADEIFGGYPSFNDVPKLKILGALPHSIASWLVKLLPNNLQEKLRGISSYSVEELTVNRRRFTSIEQLNHLHLQKGTPQIPQNFEQLDTMGKISLAEIYGYMIPMLLRDSDQMSMAVSLELRVPFVDHVLVEEVLAIPQKYKKGKGTKPLLIAAFKDDLPLEVYNRPKQGFVLPMDEWMRGPLAQFVKEGTIAATQMLKTNEPEHQRVAFEKKQLHWTRVWQWCILGHWLINVLTLDS